MESAYASPASGSTTVNDGWFHVVPFGAKTPSEILPASGPAAECVATSFGSKELAVMLEKVTSASPCRSVILKSEVVCSQLVSPVEKKQSVPPSDGQGDVCSPLSNESGSTFSCVAADAQLSFKPVVSPERIGTMNGSVAGAFAGHAKSWARPGVVPPAATTMAKVSTNARVARAGLRTTMDMRP